MSSVVDSAGVCQAGYWCQRQPARRLMASNSRGLYPAVITVYSVVGTRDNDATRVVWGILRLVCCGG